MKAIYVCLSALMILMGVNDAHSEAVLQLTNYGKAGVVLKQILDSNLTKQENVIQQMWLKQLQSGELDYWFMAALDKVVSHYNDDRESAVNRLRFYNLGPAVTDDTVAEIIKADHFYFTASSSGYDSTKFIAVTIIGKNIEVSDSSNWVTLTLLVVTLIVLFRCGVAIGAGSFTSIPTGIVALCGIISWVVLSSSYESFPAVMALSFLLALLAFAAGHLYGSQ